MDLSITLPITAETLRFIVQVVGLGFVVYSFYRVQNVRLLSLVLGAVIFYGSQWIYATPNVPPNPNPNPNPAPAPFSSFADEVKRSFNGTKAEAQIIGALHEAMAHGLEFDGRRTKPAVTTTSQMGAMFAELQRYRMRNEAPWGERFNQTASVLAREARARGVISDRTEPLDATRRQAAINFYREVGQIFSSIR